MVKNIAHAYNLLIIVVSVWSALTAQDGLLRVLAWIVALGAMLIGLSMARSSNTETQSEHTDKANK